MAIKTPEVWVIKHRETGDLWKANSGKSSWKAKGHAKNAWSNSNCYFNNNVSVSDYEKHVKHTEMGPYYVYNPGWNKPYYAYPKFDEQQVYEVVRVDTEADDMKGAIQQFLEAYDAGLLDIDAAAEQFRKVIK